jgi:serine/threonine protein kinase
LGLISGARLGPYETRSAIGAGGMGEVYWARDRWLDRHLAIVILPEAFAPDTERITRFRGEAKTLASFRGLSVEEAADVLHVAADTVKPDWRLAKLWLLRDLDGDAR